ncbi:tetratricopeptide repeat protein [Marinobacter sediminum]|uniref:tetratricopeptide repeat protein n=1 Tax=Marinobacter sediminum TaxID=256323 RepID=UPI00193AA195|nr:tetratricopeptide repeat protein [Marinobacter sediminum]
MRRFVCALMSSLLMPLPTAGQESFRVELGRDGETIADMRPVYLKFESRPMPAISPAEVARRYQQLFRSSDEPAVRIDALNRLTNIRDRTGQDLGFSPEEEERVYGEVLSSYEAILGQGSFGGRLDELLYQMAKAYALTGQSEQSVDRLKQLVGLYPQSPLVPEARFRIAESDFSAGRFAEAETGYRALINGEHAGALIAKAQYMLGWSQFKQGPSAWERAGLTFLSVLNEFLPDAHSLQNPQTSAVDAIDDTFRALALMAARKEGPDTLAAWLKAEAPRHWAYLLFDRLADFYAVQGDYEASVATNKWFVRSHPNHPKNPAFMAQIAAVWERAGKPDAVRAAKADYIAMYAAPSSYQGLSEPDQARWQSYSRTLADFHYNQGTLAFAKNDKVRAQGAFSAAASYYESLASRAGSAGQLFRLAGDARLQAGQYLRALSDYQRAAYQTDHYPEAADAGWAALVLLRDGLEADRRTTEFRPDLATVSVESDRFEQSFPDDSRLSGLTADLASRWLASGNLESALTYAGRTATNAKASAEERYAAWLVIAKARQSRREYALAERAWKQVLQEMPESNKNDSEGNAKQQLAGAIYRQGEAANARGDLTSAVEHFTRIEAVLPGSEIAIKGRFDAANSLLKAGRWALAIEQLRLFRTRFSDHELAAGISDKLVHAYVASDQPVQAANELLGAASTAAEPWPLQLKAAELFHLAGDQGNRDRLYLSYLKTNPSAEDAEQHLQLQTMRHRLINSGEPTGNLRSAMVASELASPWHSEESLAWSARAALVLGARDAAIFTSIPLSQPLADSLDRKQRALESARMRFLEAEQLGGEAVRSETLFRRAELYRVFAQDLMTSSVPADLNELEAMQYQMLLEEEAFPFEEKAIALHSDNHRRVTDHGYDGWIGKSLGVLAQLNPGRYSRAVRWMTWKDQNASSGGPG